MCFVSAAFLGKVLSQKAQRKECLRTWTIRMWLVRKANCFLQWGQIPGSGFRRFFLAGGLARRLGSCLLSSSEDELELHSSGSLAG